MKNKAKEKKNKKKIAVAVTTKQRISTKIISDFLRVNFVVFGLMVFIWLLVYLAAHQYDSVYNIVVGLLQAFFPESIAQWILDNSFLAVAAVYLLVFLVLCFGYSVSTLINFDKTWRSLGGILSDDYKIRKFSKSYSDIEIALKDIKHNVFKNQQLAAQAENRKNDLVMYLAHDLKTPLTSIIGYLSLLEECPELTAIQRSKYIGITLDKAYRLEQLISEFFEITRFNKDSITLENNRIDLGMMLSQIADEFYPMFSEKNLSYKLQLQEKILMYADSDKIARVFDNLLKNAVNYCYEGSEIIIGAKIKDSKVIIRFRNHCDEIPKEKLDRLFDKFFRLDSSRSTLTGGSGLGLAISKQLVELHGGTITAKSTAAHTDFTVILPYKEVSFFEEEDENFDN
ncbi:MAG: HAMP domain-containing histidine kinase [Clostridia bacterium]|nr:HAMP domain-containing histidine kinase [Clostridia bacterium]